MKIKDSMYVAIEYMLFSDSGDKLDSSDPGKPLGFIYGSGQVIPGLEKGLKDMEKGQSAKITVEPVDGYGELKDELFREIPRENFPADAELKEGIGFEASTPHGTVKFKIKTVKDDVVIADFNHPLAGERLHFDLTVTEVREPSVEEMASLGGCGCGTQDSSSCGSSCGGGCSC
ncbi:MAG TPA: peptidylprolyl isomerase [Thermodesulfobacteriaceae bacterium]|nr:peptidylprolyl isomerase [Thermodesulfobacteriaceae bacterium]